MFHSVYQRYAQEEQSQTQTLPVWPPLYRHQLPTVDLETFVFKVGVDKQPPRSFTWTQIKALPAFNELRLIASKTGWAYRGHWKGLTFQTIFSLFATPHLYDWVKLESLCGQTLIIERQQLLNWRVLYECDNHDLPTLYGGPLWVHHFDQYIEFAFPHLSTMTLLQSAVAPIQAQDPFKALGYDLHNDAKIDAGQYYALHEERVVSLGHLGRKL